MVEVALTNYRSVNLLQLLVNSLELVCYCPFDVSVFRSECFLKGLLYLSQVLDLYLVGFDVCVDSVQFFLNNITGGVPRLRLNDS